MTHVASIPAVLAGLSTALLLAGPGSASATDWPAAGDWVVRAGLHLVDPKSNNLTLDIEGDPVRVSVDDDIAPTFSVSYFITPAVAVELQAATPFEHDINLGGARVGSTKHIPPTLNIQYHLPLGPLKPYVGTGLNWTLFFSEKTTGALDGADLELDDSFGINFQAGVDYALNSDWYLNAEVRWIDIDSRADLDGERLGTVEIDPFVAAVTVGRRF